MIATTSAIAYDEIKADGTVRTQTAVIINALFIHGPMTRREISAVTGIEPGAVAGRVNELIKVELLADDGEKRDCKITGRLAKVVNLLRAIHGNA